MVEILQEKLSEIGPDERSKFSGRTNIKFPADEAIRFLGERAFEIFGQTQNKRVDCPRRVIKALRINSNQSNN